MSSVASYERCGGGGEGAGGGGGISLRPLLRDGGGSGAALCEAG